MTKFNITLAVPAEALPALMTDLSVYCAELVKVEQAEVEAAAPAVRATPITKEEVFTKPLADVVAIDRKPGGKRTHHTSAAEVYDVTRSLYQTTGASFRSQDVWHALRARGINASRDAVYQHLIVLRQMGYLKAVAGRGAGGGYFNVVTRDVEADVFEAEYREYLEA
ncbi:MAG: hypothetical protein DWQ28_06575 [Proteobacteria bacterium]|nr:MAG: hypothetical protein DWQ28_06270 [Pseudomonadota bacterium]REJ67697.1 MAG: hypothetical protein DWQ28_06575 [Pseudomonadota bacterium]